MSESERKGTIGSVYDRFLVSLFNGISTFVGYLMPKPFSKKKSSGTISPIAGRIRGSYLSQGYLPVS